MSEKSLEKYRNKVDVTWEQYFKHPYWYPSIGLIELVREMEKELGKERAHQILDKMSLRMILKMADDYREHRKVTKFEDYSKATRENFSDPFWSNTLTVEVLEDTPSKLSVMITGCLWAKSMRELGAEDIGYILNCKHDPEMCQRIHPKLRLRKTKTLMEGDDYCDYTWYWDEEL